MKIRPVEAVFVHADSEMDRQANRRTGRQTDITKLVVAFCNFAIAPKILPVPEP